MTERENNENASVFVPKTLSKPVYEQPVNDVSRTEFRRNVIYKGTPNSTDYISIENRRQYVYK